MGDKDMQYFFDSLDDTVEEWRLFVLDQDSGEIVCSEILTNRESQRRLEGAAFESRPITVDEAQLKSYRELRPGAPVLARHFTSHSELGTIGMFWELLARAWDKQRAEEKEQEHEQA